MQAHGVYPRSPGLRRLSKNLNHNQKSGKTVEEIAGTFRFRAAGKIPQTPETVPHHTSRESFCARDVGATTTTIDLVSHQVCVAVDPMPSQRPSYMKHLPTKFAQILSVRF